MPGAHEQIGTRKDGSAQRHKVLQSKSGVIRKIDMQSFVAHTPSPVFHAVPTCRLKGPPKQALLACAHRDESNATSTMTLAVLLLGAAEGSRAC